jgi:ATP-dependent RNA helicase DeaD
MFLKDELDPKSYKLIRESNREDKPAAFGREDRRDGGRDRDRGSRDRDRDGGRGRDRDRDNDGGYGRGRNADGNMRLFIAKGRQDKYSPKMLLDLICGQTDVPSRKIDDIKIFDQFSFFSINAEDGETILEIFRRQAKKENIKPLVERARERN